MYNVYNYVHSILYNFKKYVRVQLNDASASDLQYIQYTIYV